MGLGGGVFQHQKEEGAQKHETKHREPTKMGHVKAPGSQNWNNLSNGSNSDL